MNSVQAKQVLLTYRPGSADEADPEVQEALQMVRGDAELQSWLDQQLIFQRSVRSQLEAIAIPSGLKSRILTQQRIVKVSFWRRPEFLLAAACVVLAFVLSALWWGRPTEQHTFAAFRNRMVGFALRSYRMDIVTNDLGTITQYLHQQGAPAQYEIAAPLRGIPAMGGARLSWQGHPVAMVCFGLPKNQILYMFVMDTTAVDAGPLPSGKPDVQLSKRVTTASWKKGDKLYLVAAADFKAVERLSKSL